MKHGPSTMHVFLGWQVAVSTQDQIQSVHKYVSTGAVKSARQDSLRETLHQSHVLAELRCQRARGGRGTPAFDEMQSAEGARDHCLAFAEQLDAFGFDELSRRQEKTNEQLSALGVTFSVYEDAQNTERTWPLDVIPRIVDGEEWRTIERGLEQRIRALNQFIDDVYNKQSILRDAVVPRALIESAPSFRPMLRGLQPPQGVWSHVSGVDLVRDADGTIYVLEDNLRCPSGVSYALENRKLVQASFSGAYHASGVVPVNDYPQQLLARLSSLVSTAQNQSANVVVLSPGGYNSAYFEHTYLAQRMGVPLVYGSDLFVRNRHVYMQTTAGASRVDVIYRRIDDDFLDPKCFCSDSLIGVPGLMEAYLAGNVALANAPGCGVADDKAVYAYVPQIIEYYTGEKPILSNVPTYLCDRRAERDYVLSNLRDLVVKPTNESGGYGVMIGPHSSSQQHEECAAAIRSNPRGYIAQPMLNLSTVPTIQGNSLEPRHVDLRPFVLLGRNDNVYVMPGGLTRVALPAGSMIVNSSQGGGSKDTWVLEHTDRRERRRNDSRLASRINSSVLVSGPVASAIPLSISGHKVDGIRKSPGSCPLPKRVAFSLYWLHRYLERAECLARILQGRIDFSPDTVAATSWKNLIAVFGNVSLCESLNCDLPSLQNQSTAVAHLTTDISNVNSILACLNSARENARIIRNTLPDAVWKPINTTYLGLHRLANVRSHETLGWVFDMLEQVIRLNVQVDGYHETMAPRNESWHITALGRLIERADGISRRLQVLSVPDGQAVGWLQNTFNPQSVRSTVHRAAESISWLGSRSQDLRCKSLTRIQLLNEKLVRFRLKPSAAELRSFLIDFQLHLNTLSNQIVRDFMTMEIEATRTTEVMPASKGPNGHVTFQPAEIGLPQSHLTIATTKTAAP